MEISKKANLQNPKLTKPSQHRLEDALSLRDLPLNNKQPNSTTTTEHHREPSTELFEFLTTTSYDVSPAENIIFGGKLIPLNYQNALFSPPENITKPRIRDNARLKRTSPSLNDCKRSRGPTTGHSPPVHISPARYTVKPETPSWGSGKSARPRWYVIMFGMVKFPPEIELKDIKNRQIRRDTSPVMFPSNANRRSCKSRSASPSWRFLNALSCKEPTCVAATVPFRMSHV